MKTSTIVIIVVAILVVISILYFVLIKGSNSNNALAKEGEDCKDRKCEDGNYCDCMYGNCTCKKKG
jgi:uncharacterized membrane protein YqiK